MAGKGDKWRPTDWKKFRDNWDYIKKRKRKERKKK